MYAVVETGGKQYRVQEGDVISVERLDAAAGDIVTLDKVLALGEGDAIDFGTPYIAGAGVTAEVQENGKGKKVIVFKYKAKKDYRKKQGHRQPYTSLKIVSLTGDKPAEKAASAVAEMPQADAQAPKKVSASMKKDELLAIAAEQGIALDAKATKADIIAAIESVK